MPDPTIERFRSAVAAGYSELERRRGEVNDLNVFPVADGDTGDNMAMTMRAVLEELDRINGQVVDPVARGELVRAVARAALLGARGNSGVILSQIVRGAAEELASRPGELVDPVLVAAALATAADAAYDSVREPAEGTMLSAVRAMAHRVARDLAHMQRQRLGPNATDAEQDELLAEVLERALDAGSEAVERGPEQLAVLRDAGVVDAGAYGLTVIIAGVVAALRGEEAPELEHQLAVAPHAGHEHGHESSRYRYCTNFAVTGESLVGQTFVPQLEELGDSVLVVGDERTLRVHVHTDQPERAAALFEGAGALSRFDVADMREQVAERSERLAGRDEPALEVCCRAVVVANGAGVASMFEDLGAVVVDGGPTLNPSTYEILAGIHASAADEVVVLPNSPNVILAAERAAELSEKPAWVVPTRSQQTGLAALLSLEQSRAAAENAAAVSDAAAAVRSGGVAVAARDDVDGRFREGDALGYVDERLVACGAVEHVLRETLACMAEERELVTCIAGSDAPLGRDAVESSLPATAELDFHQGDQPAWWWLLVAE